jgi:glucan phosphoethanolaminetransferase (alkaline phosphatase superfamily)
MELGHVSVGLKQSDMTKAIRLKWEAELLWWILTLIIIVMVLLPVYKSTSDYPFYVENTLFIIIFITFFRYIFFLPLSFIARKKWIKVFIILAAAIFFFVSITALGDFRNFVDEKGLQTLVDHLHVTEQSRVIEYVKNQMIFFGVGSIITGIILPIRMIISLWRMKNKGTV